MIDNNYMFNVGYKLLTYVLIFEALVLGYELFYNGYSNKAFLIIGFMIIAKLSQINTILYFNKLKND